MKIRLKRGDITAEFEGEQAEVGQLINEFLKSTEKLEKSPKIATRKSFTGSLSERIEILKSEGFFKQPKKLKDIKKRLAELGYHYPRTTISPVLIQLTRQRNLRRIGSSGSYKYVNP